MYLSGTTHEILTEKNHTLGVERGPLFDSSGGEVALLGT